MGRPKGGNYASGTIVSVNSATVSIRDKYDGRVINGFKNGQPFKIGQEVSFYRILKSGKRSRYPWAKKIKKLGATRALQKK